MYEYTPYRREVCVDFQNDSSLIKKNAINYNIIIYDISKYLKNLLYTMGLFRSIFKR